MLKSKSNIDKFIAVFKEKSKKINTSLVSIAEKIARVMCEDMRNEINSKRDTWWEKGGLEDIEEVDFTVTPTSPNSVLVSIGENLPKLTMSDGTLVNPAFFIEFGFGIVGNNAPADNTEEYSWEYNVNEHEHRWYFYGKDKEVLWSKGTVGLNFMYNTITDYQSKWSEFVISLLKEGDNNG